MTDKCEKKNIRFMFLPENSTHILQPLDVAVFGPMKKWWRSVLRNWKDCSAAIGKNYSTLPKTEFPKLLRMLLSKDYTNSIISGFRTTGLFPLCPEHVLQKLPSQDGDVVSSVQRQLLNKLSELRYGPGNTPAPRPRQKDRLPAGAAYTCPKKEEAAEQDSEISESDEISTSDSENYSEGGTLVGSKKEEQRINKKRAGQSSRLARIREQGGGEA